MLLKISSAKWQPFCLGGNELIKSVPSATTREANDNTCTGPWFYVRNTPHYLYSLSIAKNTSTPPKTPVGTHYNISQCQEGRMSPQIWSRVTHEIDDMFVIFLELNHDVTTQLLLVHPQCDPYGSTSEVWKIWMTEITENLCHYYVVCCHQPYLLGGKWINMAFAWGKLTWRFPTQQLHRAWSRIVNPPIAFGVLCLLFVRPGRKTVMTS